MAVVGTAWIAVKAQQDGSFEATLIKDVKQAAAAAEAGAKLTPVVDTSKATGPLDLLKNKLTSFAGSSNPVTKGLTDITTASGGAESALAGVASGGLAIAGAAAVAFATKSVASFQEYAGAARAVQRVTGTSAEDASRLAAAFRAVGIAPDQAAPSLGRFARNLATQGEALGKLGVEISKNKDGTTNMKETFLNVADAISKAKDPTEQLNISMTAFGRGGQALLPILMKGKEGITELFGEAGKHGMLFSQKELDTSKELSMAFRQVKETIAGVFVEAGKYVAPFVLDIINIGQGIGELAGKFTVVKDIIKAALVVSFAPLILIVKSIDLLSKAVDFLTGKHHAHAAAAKDDADAIGDAADTTDELAGATERATAAAVASTKADEDHKKAVETLQSAISGVTAAQRDLRDANKNVTDAQGKQTEAQQHLNELNAKGTVDTEKLASANQNLAQAQQTLASTQDKLVSSGQAIKDAEQQRTDALGKQADAQQRVNELISGQAAAEDLVAHRHDLEHATLNVRNAQASLTQALKDKEAVTTRVADAEAKLAELRAGHTATQKDLDQAGKDVQDAQASQADDLASAQLRVDEATLSLSESQENLTDTQQNLNDIQKEGEAGSKTLAAAQQVLAGANRDVEAANRTLESATRDQTQAQKDLAVAQADVVTKQGDVNKAMQPDPKLISDVKTANKDVATAIDGVKDAAFNAAQKAGDLATKQGDLKKAMNESIGDLSAVKTNLQDIVNLQPQAQAFIQPTIDMVNALIQAAAGILQPGGGKIKTTPQGDVYYSPTGGRIPAHATGGWAGGDFLAGEQGPELISMRAGSNAMVYAANTPESRGGVGMPPVSISIEASFGPGTNSADVLAAMRSIAANEMTEALKAVLAKAAAGKRH